MSKKNNRVNFTSQIRELAYRRAGSICSQPSCRISLTGPSTTDQQSSVNLGVVAHITAASVGGPRYDATITDDKRNSIENAILLCQTCSVLIDKNNGNDYSVELLREWKCKHEKWMQDNLGKKSQDSLTEVNGSYSVSGHGNIIGMDVQAPTIIKPGTSVIVSGTGNLTGIRITNSGKK
ncbi:MAG: hypothetical protein NT027_20315 [Proteobacteria bacterium]|nr:hypothetical protein [Pseudomonadota bacterium]